MKLANISICKSFFVSPSHIKVCFSPGFAVVLLEGEDVLTTTLIRVSASKSTPSNFSKLDNDIMLVVRITVVFKTKLKSLVFCLVVNLIFFKLF